MRYALFCSPLLLLWGCTQDVPQNSFPAADEATIAQIEAEIASLESAPPGTGATVDGNSSGLVGDGITLNTDTFRSLMAKGNQTIRIRAGDYVTGSFGIASGTIVILEPGTTIRDSGDLRLDERLISIKSQNVKIFGTGARVIADRARYDTGEQRHGVYIFGARNVLIDGLEVSGHGGDGFYIGGPKDDPSTDITLKGCRSDNNRRQGLSITSARRVRIADCEFMNTAGTAPEFGIDIEPNYSTDVLDDVVLLRPQTSGNRGGGLLILLDKLDTVSQPIRIVVIDHHSVDEWPALDSPARNRAPGAVYYNHAP